MKIDVYSKPGCGYCDMAKDALSKRGLQYTEHVVGSTISREDFIKKFHGVKTVPQITIDEKHVGGYTDLVEWMKTDGTNI